MHGDLSCVNPTFELLLGRIYILLIIMIIIIIITIIVIIAFSRNERTHPNLVSQAREIEIFWTANWPPL